MKKFDTNAFQRLGGASSKRLRHDLGQEMLEKASAEQLTPSQLTTAFFNDLEGSWFGNRGWPKGRGLSGDRRTQNCGVWPPSRNHDFHRL